MNLCAFAFVGERHNTAHLGSRSLESSAMNMLTQSLSEIPLSDKEREMLTALATGMELGYGEEAVQKFKDILVKTREQVKDRKKLPDDIGEDLLESLIEAKI
jgi:hypothetical protein